jgi:predicted transcriptional regulator
VFSIRLSDDEREQLERVARQRGIAPSVLARQWIGERLSAESDATDLASIANTLSTLSATLRSLPRP